jgi:hypothetical protein
MSVEVKKPRALGDTVFVDVEFFDTAGARVDPTTVAVDIDLVGQAPITLTYGQDAQITKDGVIVGKYTLTLVLDTPGRLDGRWRGAGALAAVETFSLYVDNWPTNLV